MLIVPVPLPLAAVAVMVTVPVVPPRVPEPVVELVVLMLMMEELLEVQFAAMFEVKVMADPVPPFPERLIVLPEVHVLHVIVMVVAPTVTDAVPLKPLLRAVIVTAVVVLATPVARPVLLTETCAGSELLQVDVLVRFLVLPSSLLPVAVNC